MINVKLGHKEEKKFNIGNDSFAFTISSHQTCQIKK